MSSGTGTGTHAHARPVFVVVGVAACVDVFMSNQHVLLAQRVNAFIAADERFVNNHKHSHQRWDWSICWFLYVWHLLSPVRWDGCIINLERACTQRVFNFEQFYAPQTTHVM